MFLILGMIPGWKGKTAVKCMESERWYHYEMDLPI